MFRMFAHVAVSNGTPSIAMLPLHEVLPGDYILRSFSGAFIAKTWPQKWSMSQKGGTVSMNYYNDLGTPFRVAVSWDAPGWEVRPPSAEVRILPGKSMELKFVLRPRGENPDFPTYRISYEATNPAGRKVSYTSEHTVTFPAELLFRPCEALPSMENPTTGKT